MGLRNQLRFVNLRRFGIAALVLMAGSLLPASAPAQVAATPAPNKHLYSETANPKADIAAALTVAKREHKRVILDFGGDWCSECILLDVYFRESPNKEILAKNFVVVRVYIGHMDANMDVPAKYGAPVKRGVPLMAVLDASGKVLYAQQPGEGETLVRTPDAKLVTDFLNKWKPGA